MSRPVAILRPEPGNAATAARALALGLEVIRLPLFEIRPLSWPRADPAAYDALLLTSANAVRHAGPRLHDYARLPVFAVGQATAAAAQTAGLSVVAIGERGVDALLDRLAEHGVARALHLAGRDRILRDTPRIADVRTVYASEAVAVARDDAKALSGCVALLHSPRAAVRFGGVIDDAGVGRASIAVATLSAAVADAAGSGWESVAVATAPDDAALLALAVGLAD